MTNNVGSIVSVGIAGIHVVSAPLILRTVGLGSCVGLVLFDSTIKAAAMAHIMLPDSSIARGTVEKPGKFADTAVAELVKMLTRKGADVKRLKAKMAGGAMMFSFTTMKEAAAIGKRNVEAIEAQLNKYGIRKVSAKVGGNKGRTVEFDVESEIMRVRTVNEGVVEI
ncbi:MAG TPA: chemotaxis protein CheD [Bacillales bacterium]|nr:chemotaxis protein CheD [Bacillales bacterium]